MAATFGVADLTGPLETLPISDGEPSYKIMRIALYGVRRYIKLERDGAGCPA